MGPRGELWAEGVGCGVCVCVCGGVMCFVPCALVGVRLMVVSVLRQQVCIWPRCTGSMFICRGACMALHVHGSVHGALLCLADSLMGACRCLWVVYPNGCSSLPGARCLSSQMIGDAVATFCSNATVATITCPLRAMHVILSFSLKLLCGTSMISAGRHVC